MKRYYPLIDVSGEGDEKAPLFFTDSLDTARANHRYFLEEYAPDCYILHCRNGEPASFSIRCPKCGKALSNQYSNYYTCLPCKK